MARVVFLALIAVIVSATAVAARQTWMGPGWYQITEDMITALYAGPFVSEQACKASLPSDYADDGLDPPLQVKFYCRYLDERPDFDKMFNP